MTHNIQFEHSCTHIIYICNITCYMYIYTSISIPVSLAVFAFAHALLSEAALNNRKYVTWWLLLKTIYFHGNHYRVLLMSKCNIILLAYSSFMKCHGSTDFFFTFLNYKLKLYCITFNSLLIATVAKGINMTRNAGVKGLILIFGKFTYEHELASTWTVL